MGKKNKPLPPRRFRMNREGRLSSAKGWLAKFQGDNVIRGYKNQYGVNWECAVAELRLLGIKLNEKYVGQVLESASAQTRHRQLRKQQLKSASATPNFDSDEQFAFIVGYTDGGCPFGVTWDEWEDD